jgi:peptidoglycan-associated lipoprotein
MRQQARSALPVVVSLVLVLAGCAEQSNSGGVSATAADQPGAAAPATAPNPSEFVATDNLKDIHFDFDKYEIRPGDARILDANAAWLKANPRALLLIEGSSDERGTNEYNLALSERRARVAMNYLVGQGVQASRITLTAYGKERALCAEHNEACWAKNRRAHFLTKAQ